MYRLSVLLKEEIQPDVLQQALDMTLPRFPTYKAAIRKGLFCLVSSAWRSTAFRYSVMVAP